MGEKVLSTLTFIHSQALAWDLETQKINRPEEGDFALNPWYICIILTAWLICDIVFPLEVPMALNDMDRIKLLNSTQFLQDRRGE